MCSARRWTGAAARLAIHDPSAPMCTGRPRTPAPSTRRAPLPGGGNAVTEHVADQTGWHYVAVATGDGDYDVTVEVYRPRLETDRPVQTIFLDFDGPRLNTTIFGGPGVRTLSPLRAFLGRWGLTNAN